MADLRRSPFPGEARASMSRYSSRLSSVVKTDCLDATTAGTPASAQADDPAVGRPVGERGVTFLRTGRGRDAEGAQDEAPDEGTAPADAARAAGTRLYRFDGGLRLRHHKKMSCEVPVQRAALPQRLYVPLLQHTGREAEASVVTGQQVLKGDPIGCFRHLGSGCVHAPTSGTVSAVVRHPISHPSGRDGLCIVIRPDGLDQWRQRRPIENWAEAAS